MSAAKKIFSGIGQLVTSLFSPDEPEVQAPPPAPKAEPVKAQPLPDDAAVRRAKRRSIAEQSGRGGRASTILTSGLGAVSGGGGKLGSSA